MSNVVYQDEVKGTGTGECEGGTHPERPLDEFPLLGWSAGRGVFLEDGAATVAEVLAAAAEAGGADAKALAARFSTTEEHVRQALAYGPAVGGA